MPFANLSATARAGLDASGIKCSTSRAKATASNRFSLSKPSTALKHHKVSFNPLDSNTVSKGKGSSSGSVLLRWLSKVSQKS
jgi:hypothetical protein